MFLYQFYWLYIDLLKNVDEFDGVWQKRQKINKPKEETIQHYYVYRHMCANYDIKHENDMKFEI